MNKINILNITISTIGFWGWFLVMWMFPGNENTPTLFHIVRTIASFGVGSMYGALIAKILINN